MIWTALKLIGGFARTYRIWFVIVGLASVIGSGVLLVHNHATTKARNDALETENAGHVKTIRAQAAQIATLNQRISDHNARLMEAVEREKARVIRAQDEADEIRAQRDRITAELSDSRRAWLEAVEHDEDLVDFISHVVPGAIWHRLHAAAGNPR